MDEPATQQVLDILDREGPLTPSEVSEQLGMPQRTVRYALGRLKDRDRVGWRQDIQDARFRLYFSKDPEPPDPGPAEPGQARRTAPQASGGAR